MESQDRRKNSPSGSEGHGIHVCHKCGWPFPNARPSAKHRKAHKRVCGTIEGYKAHLGGSDDEHLSDNDSKTLSNGLETVEKAAEMAVSSRSFSGVGSGSNRSTRSEEDVFSDAVTDFGGALGVSDSDDVREPAKQQVISADDRVAKGVAGGSDTQYYMPTTTMGSLAASEEESSVSENTLQCSKTSSVLNSEEEGSLKGVLFEKSEDIATVPTKNAGIASEVVFVPPKVNGDSLELVSEDAAMEVIGKESNVFGENSDSFPKDGFDARMNSLDNSSEAMNVKSGGYNVLVVPNGLPSGEHSKDLPEKLPAAATLDPAQEVECLGLSEDSVTQGTLAEPGESDNKNSKEIISEALHQEDNSDGEIFVEMNSKKNNTLATDADISEPSSMVVHLDKDINEAGQGKAVTEEQNPLVFSDTNLQLVLDDGDIHTHSMSSVKPGHDGSAQDNEDAEFSDALEADGPKVAEEELPRTNGTSFISDICITAEKNLLGGGNGDDYDGRSTEVKKLSDAIPSIPEFEDSGYDKVEVEGKYGNVLEAATSDSSNPSLLQCDVETKKLQDSVAAVKDLGSLSEQMVIGESAGAAVASAISSVGDNVCAAEPTHIDEYCMQKASDSIDVSLTKKVKDNDVQLEKIEISGAKDLENVGDKMSGEECICKVDIGLISDNDDDNDFTQNAAKGFNTGEHAEAVSSVEDRYAKERDGISSSFNDKDRKLVKQEDVISELDIQADLISQTDSLEGNWGSVSVLSTLSDVQAATDTGSQPSQESVKGEKANLQPKSNNGKSDIFQPPSYMSSVEQKADEIDQNEGAPEAQTSQKPQENSVGFPSLAPMANESSGRKRNEEIIAKVTNWRTGKQNMPLKSYLGQSSPSAKDNPPPISQETKNTVMGTKEVVDEAAREELGKEGNSPARYPTNIKREKGKVRSRPLWATFICCSSVQTS